MNRFLFVVLAVLALAACADPEPPRERTMPGMEGMPPTGAPHLDAGNSDSGMVQMNRMMVDHLGPADDNYDRRFIDLMIPHHEGALAMALDASTNAVHPELKQFAEQIVTEQRAEIAKMRQWRGEWYDDTSNTTMMTSPMMMDVSHRNDSMTMGMLRAGDSPYDRRFIEMMIPHHEGAIAMAEDALGKTKREPLKQLARAIAASQKEEIARMRQWLRQWYPG